MGKGRMRRSRRRLNTRMRGGACDDELETCQYNLSECNTVSAQRDKSVNVEKFIELKMQLATEQGKVMQLENKVRQLTRKGGKRKTRKRRSRRRR